MIRHAVSASKERALSASNQFDQNSQPKEIKFGGDKTACQKRIAYLVDKLFNDESHVSSYSEARRRLLLEVGDSLSVSLREYFKSKDVQFTIQERPLDLEELFGVNGLLMIFCCELKRYLQGVEVGLSWYFVGDDTALANVILRFDGDPFDFASILRIRNAIIEIANGLEITEVDGENLCAVDELYLELFDMAQNGNLIFKQESDFYKVSASQFSEKAFGLKCYGLAEDAMRKVLIIRSTILGDEHLATLECKYRLAACLYQRGNQLAAQNLLFETAEKLESAYGAGHEETLRARSHLATACLLTGGVHTSKELLENAKIELIESLGIDHLLTQALVSQIDETLKLHSEALNARGGEIKNENLLEAVLQKERTVVVCDTVSFQNRLKQETGKEHEKKLAVLKTITQPKMLPHIPGQVFVEVERIGNEQPNFSKVTELVLDTLHTQAITGRAAQFPPMLLFGPPGVGKTRYIKRIAAALAVPFMDIQLAGIGDGFTIGGLSRYWDTAGPGAVANVFVANDVANPVFLLDEIDKTKANEKSDPLSVILLLLEKESSRSFKDLFIDIPMDVSHASFIATANDISELPESVLSRFHCIDVPPLDYEGRCTMVKTVYTELLAEEELLGFLDQELAPSTLDALAGYEALTGREIKREILLAMQRACRTYKLGQKQQSITLTVEHLRLTEKRLKRAIGFIS